MAFRGGFSGASRNTGGMMGGQKLPFEIDAGLDDEIAKYRDEDTQKEALAKDPRELYPPYPGGVPRAPPLTAREKRAVQLYRAHIAKKHAGPFYTGPPGTVDKMIAGSKRSAADFNAFEDQETYGKKFQKTEWKWPDITKHKFAQPELFPRELWSTIGYNPDVDPEQANKNKKLMLAKNNIVDKLAKFDDDADDAAGDADDANDDDVAENAEDEEGEGQEELQDDDFEEDEDDGNDDYNAEQYFDGGDDDFEEGGAEEYGGGDDGCDDVEDGKWRGVHAVKEVDHAAVHRRRRREMGGDLGKWEVTYGAESEGRIMAHATLSGGKRTYYFGDE